MFTHTRNQQVNHELDSLKLIYFSNKDLLTAIDTNTVNPTMVTIREHIESTQEHISRHCVTIGIGASQNNRPEISHEQRKPTE